MALRPEISDLKALITAMQSKTIENQNFLKNKVLANLELLKHALKELSPNSPNLASMSSGPSAPVATGPPLVEPPSNPEVRRQNQNSNKKSRQTCGTCGSPAHAT